MLIDYQQLPTTVTGIFHALNTPPVEAVWDSLPAKQKGKALELARVDENWGAYDKPYSHLTIDQQQKVLTGLSLIYFKLKCEDVVASRKSKRAA